MADIISLKNDIEAVYDMYADMLYRLSLSYLQNSEDARDAVQDVFIKYATASDIFKDDEHKKAWLIRVTVNCCNDMLRRRKHDKEKKQDTDQLLAELEELRRLKAEKEQNQE